jgi:predicted DNA-binding transcriptional regulator AlpA
MSPKLYTSREAAKAVGISHGTLYAWLAAKKFAPPALATSSGVMLWTAEDVDRLKRKKQEIYQKGHPRMSKDRK